MTNLPQSIHIGHLLDQNLGHRWQLLSGNLSMKLCVGSEKECEVKGGPTFSSSICILPLMENE